MRDLVKTVLSIENGASVTIHSLTTNPINSNSKVATLSFHIVPASLSNSSKNEWVFTMPSDQSLNEMNFDRRMSLVFDTHFSGFTPLQHAPDNECHVE